MVLEGLTAMSVALIPTIITITKIISTSFLFIDLELVSLVKINASGIRFIDIRILSLTFRSLIEAKVLVEIITVYSYILHAMQCMPKIMIIYAITRLVRCDITYEAQNRHILFPFE